MAKIFSSLFTSEIVFDVNSAAFVLTLAAK